MTSPDLARVLRETGPILLDFDGPVTPLFVDGRNRLVADAMRQVTEQHGLALPGPVVSTEDPILVLQWVATELPSILAQVEAACVQGEIDAAHRSEPTAGSFDFLDACARMRRPVVIDSNNAFEAIDSYLGRFAIRHQVAAVFARPFAKPELMKPHPHVVARALAFLDRAAGECVLVGDSVSDVESAQASSVLSIGYAKTRVRGAELAEAGATTTVPTMVEQADAMKTSPGRWPAYAEPSERSLVITVPRIGCTQARSLDNADQTARDLVATTLGAHAEQTSITWPRPLPGQTSARSG